MKVVGVLCVFSCAASVQLVTVVLRALAVRRTPDSCRRVGARESPTKEALIDYPPLTLSSCNFSGRPDPTYVPDPACLRHW
jgi:hypothetical protein